MLAFVSLVFMSWNARLQQDTFSVFGWANEEQMVSVYVVSEMKPSWVSHKLFRHVQVMIGFWELKIGAYREDIQEVTYVNIGSLFLFGGDVVEFTCMKCFCSFFPLLSHLCESQWHFHPLKLFLIFVKKKKNSRLCSVRYVSIHFLFISFIK